MNTSVKSIVHFRRVGLWVLSLQLLLLLLFCSSASFQPLLHGGPLLPAAYLSPSCCFPMGVTAFRWCGLSTHSHTPKNPSIRMIRSFTNIETNTVGGTTMTPTPTSQCILHQHDGGGSSSIVIMAPSRIHNRQLPWPPSRSMMTRPSSSSSSSSLLSHSTGGDGEESLNSFVDYHFTETTNNRIGKLGTIDGRTNGATFALVTSLKTSTAQHIPVIFHHNHYHLKQRRSYRTSTKLFATGLPNPLPTHHHQVDEEEKWLEENSTIDNGGDDEGNNKSDAANIEMHREPIEPDPLLEDRYQELQAIAREIQRHDVLYYSSNGLGGNGATGEHATISDDEYDALCRREAELCITYPQLLERWQRESGLGIQATRYGGRVGVVEMTSSFPVSTTSTTTTAPDYDVGGNTDRLKRKHLKPMLSLDNIHQVSELLSWLGRIRKKLLASRLVQANNETLIPITVTILTEPKLDGLSLNLRYGRLDGKGVFALQWASTRGDGKQGQDVTKAVGACPSVPQTVDVTGLQHWDGCNTFEVRGEVVLPQSVFRQHVRDFGENRTFTNARNAASGILLRKETTEISSNVTESSGVTDNLYWRSQLRFYAYEMVVPNVPLDGNSSCEILASLGFCPPRPSIATTLTINDDNQTSWEEGDIVYLLKYYESLRKHRDDPSGTKPSQFDWDDYDMDGCVHKVSEYTTRLLMGNSNRAPRWAVAHKFPPTSAVTELLDVYVQVGRTGSLTPVALLKPVEIGGVSIQRATMHNFGHMQRILGGVQQISQGSKVFVRRAGEVIPQVVSLALESDSPKQTASVDTEVRMISLAAPTKCPACSSHVILDSQSGSRSVSKEDSLGQVLRCGGPALLCPPRAVSALQHAYSRDALDISGLSESRIQQLMDLGFLRIPSDLFRIAKEPQSFVEKLTNDVDGWGEKSVSNLIRVANEVATNGVSLSRYIYALGIRFVGVHSSAILARVYGSADAFLSDLDRAALLAANSSVQSSQESSFTILREDRNVSKGIGPAAISSLEAFAGEKELLEAAKALASSLTVHNDESFVNDTTAISEEIVQPLLGLNVVFTGSISGFTRNEINELAKRMGAKSTPNSVSKTTDLVVVGGKGGEKKLDKATQLGIKIADAEEFLSTAKEHGFID